MQVAPQRRRRLAQRIDASGFLGPPRAEDHPRRSGGAGHRDEQKERQPIGELQRAQGPEALGWHDLARGVTPARRGSRRDRRTGTSLQPHPPRRARASFAPAASAASLAKATSRGTYLKPQSGAATTRSGRRVIERALDAFRHRLGRLDRHVIEVENAENDSLARKVGEHAEIEPRLRRFEGDLVYRTVGEFGEEIVGRRAVLDHGRVSHAEVQRRRPLHPLQRAVDRRNGVGARGFVPRLHPRFVDLHDVGAGGEQVLHFFVDRLGTGHRQRFPVRIIRVLSLLGHRKWPRQGGLDLAVGVGAQELDVARADGPGAADRADHQRRRVRRPLARDRGARSLGVKAFQRRREMVRVTFAPHLPIGYDVDAGSLLVADGEQGRVVLRLGQPLFFDAP